MTSSILAFVTAALVAIAVGPKMIQFLAGLKARQVINEDAPKRHMEKQGTPMMGGLIILAGAAAGSLLLARSGGSDPKVIGVILLTLASGGLGFLDDFLIARRGKSLGLKARHKLLAQFLLAIGFVLYTCAVRTHDITAIMVHGRPFDLGVWYYPLAVLLVVSMSNAVNLTDGLDGLCSGLTAMVMLTMGAIALLSLRFGLSVIAFAIAGGCLGFLWYNANPAKVFMGDTGSLALGSAVAGIAIAGRMELLSVIIGAIFVFEALSVTIQVVSFKSTGKRVFKMTPIHHHFELSGWPEQKIVVRFWLIQALISVTVLGWMLPRFLPANP